MKKVYQVAGAAGAAPLALGMMMPYAGPTDVHHAAAKPKGKTVSLSHRSTARVRTCDGSDKASKIKSSLSMYYYFKTLSNGSTCVGTIFGEHFGGFPDWTMSTSISFGNGSVAVQPCPQNSKNPCTVGVHSPFRDLHHVCTSWYNPVGTLKAKVCRDPVG